MSTQSEESPEAKGLVLRRTNVTPGNCVIVRLQPDVERHALPVDLLAEGIKIEVLDVTDGLKEGVTVVTLGLLAPDAIRMDRLENVSIPRDVHSRESEEVVLLAPLSREELCGMSIADLDERGIEIREAELELRRQIGRLKADRAKASDLGWRYRDNDFHTHWWLIKEEITALTNQIDVVQLSFAQIKEAKKAKQLEVHEAQRQCYMSHFVALAKGQLSEDDYRMLQEGAKVASEKS